MILKGYPDPQDPNARRNLRFWVDNFPRQGLGRLQNWCSWNPNVDKIVWSNLDQIFKQTSRGLVADLKQTSSGLQDAFQQASMRFQALCKTSSGHQASQIISFYTTGQHVKKIQKEYILKGQVSWIWTPVMMTPCEWGPSLQRKWNFVETSA